MKTLTRAGFGRTSVRRLGVLLAASALLVSGCGGGSEDSEADDKAAPSASQEESGGGSGETDGGGDGDGGDGGGGSDGGGDGGTDGGGDGETTGGGEKDGGKKDGEKDGVEPAPDDAAVDPNCPDPGVRVMAAGPVDGDESLSLLRVMMLNCGKEPFAVNGHPDVRVLDEDGEALDVTVHEGVSAVSEVRGFNGEPKKLSLRPGETAMAVLVWRPGGGAGGRSVDVAPAEGDPWQSVTSLGGKDFAAAGELAVSPWKSVEG
ncbi:DUF4232 domain-containing protein [Streptomyces chumphonensis]|uniref:DUF4232 domain-containing protein n=1 Tax=Streptomyces chumphonensis TaxID=1214925 RepID=UPI003D738966